MKAEKLMFNDWVYNKNDESKTPFQVKKIDKNTVMDKSGCYSNLVDIRPIPLTLEILEKNGFELKPDGWLWCQESGIEDNNYIFIQFRKGCDEVRLIEFNFVNKVLAKYEQMHYVHELQHALRLCCIEKEIEL